MTKVLKSLFFSKILMAIILVIAIFTRFYNLENSLSFQGDQGRDALIVSQIFTKKDLVFIGPVTSVGNMYLGPLYYYFMLPFLWLSYPSPMGPVYAVALLGVVTVWLIHHLGKKLIGNQAALIATLFFTASSTVMTYTRFSWNPNPAPLVSLLMIYFTYQAWQKNAKYWIGVALSFAALMQLHYLALLSAGGAGLIWLISGYENWPERNKNKNLKVQLRSSLVGIFFLLLSFTPLVLFDSRHKWLNTNAFSKLIFRESNFKTSNGNGLIEKVITTILETHGRGMHTLFEISIGQQRLLNTILLVITILILGWLLLKNKKNKYWPGWVVISTYLLTGIIGTALYEHTIFDHYIAYLFPITFLIYGIVINFLISRGKTIGKLLSLTFVSYFLWFNWQNLPLKSLGWTMNDIELTSKKIYQRLKPGEKYNLVLFADSGDIDAQNYRYFLTTTDKTPLKRDRYGQAETLVVINEEHVDNIADSPIYELVTFPDKIPKETFTIPNGPEIVIFSTREDR